MAKKDSLLKHNAVSLLAEAEGNKAMKALCTLRSVCINHAKRRIDALRMGKQKKEVDQAN